MMTEHHTSTQVDDDYEKDVRLLCFDHHVIEPAQAIAIDMSYVTKLGYAFPGRAKAVDIGSDVHDCFGSSRHVVHRFSEHCRNSALVSVLGNVIGQHCQSAGMSATVPTTALSASRRTTRPSPVAAAALGA